MKSLSPIPLACGAAALLFAAPSLIAQTTIMQTGADGSSWHLPTGWNGGAVPTTTQIAGVNGNSGGAGVVGGTIVVDANAGVGSIALSGSTRKAISINSGAALALYGTGGTTMLINQSGNQNFSISGSGDLELRSSGIFSVFSAATIRSLTITTRITESGGSHQIAKTGAGTLTINNLVAATSTFTGGVHVREGALSSNVSSTGVGNAPTEGPFGTGELIFEQGTALYYTHLTSAGTYHNAIRLNGDITVGNVGPQRLTLEGGVDLTGSARVLTVSQETKIRGVIANGSLEKAGTHTLHLSGENTYAGATKITSGTLILDESGSIALSSGIEIASGATFNVQNSYALASGQTLSGIGSVDGTLRMGAGRVAAGEDGIGELTLLGDAVFDGGDIFFDLTSSGNDLITLSSDGQSLTGNTTGAVSIHLSDYDLSVGEGLYLLISTDQMTNASYTDWGLSAFTLTTGLNDWNTRLVWDSASLYVEVRAIPEGQTWALLAGGCVILGLMRRKLRHA